MNKKLIFALMFGFLLLSGVSAVSKTYDEETQTVTIKDTFLLIPIGDIAEARLTTHLNNKVGIGYQKVAEFEISGKKDWADLFYRDIKTYDKKKYDEGDETELLRTFDWKYLTYENIEVNDYDCSEGIYTNGTNYTSCEQIGSHWIEREKWNTFDKNTKVKNNINYTIGLFTNVQQGDHVEWIPNFAGKEVDEWATWSASLNTGLASYYKMDESSGAVLDAFGSNDGTNNGATPSATGKIEDAYEFVNAESDYIDLNSNFGFSGTNTMTLSAWINPDNLISRHGIISNENNDPNDLSFHTTVGNLAIVLGSTSIVSTSSPITQDVWQHVGVTYDGTTTRLFVEGNNIFNATTFTANLISVNLAIGTERGLSSVWFDGEIDEVGIWNRALSQTEMELLAEAPPFATDQVPKVVLISPANDTTFIVPNVDFVANVSDDVNLVNVSLLIDGSIDQTNTSGQNGTTYTFSKSLTTGEHNWSIIAYDNSSNSNQSETRTLNITIVPPTIQLSIPLDNLITPTASQTFYAYVVDNLNLVNVSFYYDGSIDQTNTDGTNATNYSFSKTLTEGSHTWFMEAYDNDSFSSTSATRTIKLDTIDPSITISSPVSTYGTLTNNQNLTLNFTPIDENLDTCIFEYNGANNTISCSNSTISTSYFNYSLDINNLTIYANDSAGNWGSQIKTWEFRYIENSHTFSSSVLEGSETNIKANISVGSISSISFVNLIYNGSSSLGSFSEIGGFTIFEHNQTIPQITTDENVTFIWEVVFDDAIRTNLTTQNQTILNLGIDDCSVNTYVLLNLTLLDEEDQDNFTLVNNENTTIETNLQILTSVGSISILNLTQKDSDSNPALICINQILADEEYLIDATIKYSGSQHAIEYHNLQNFVMKNSSIPKLIDLYDLNLSKSTEFQISYRNDAGIPQEDVLISVSREYVSEGVFKVVEQPQTDSVGQTVVHLVQNDVRYNFVVSKDGTILSVLNNKVAFCEDATIGKCEVNLREDVGDLDFYDYDEEFEISYTASYNVTSKEIDFDFVSIDGTVKNVTLIITKFDMIGSSPVLQESLASTSGTITYTVPASVGNATYVIDTYIDGEIMEEFTLSTKESQPMGKYGLFLFFFMFLSLIFMFSSSKSGLIIGSIIGFVTAGLFTLQGTGTGGVLTSVIWLIVAGAILLWKLNKKGGSS